MVLSTRAFAESQSWPILGKLISEGVSGCDPTIMGIGPVPAAKIALARAQMELAEMNLIEVNEAFAPQYIAVEKALGLNRDITNVNGGAISLDILGRVGLESPPTYSTLWQNVVNGMHWAVPVLAADKVLLSS